MSRFNNIYQVLEGRIVKETDKAILFSVMDTQELKTIKQEWFPKSQLSSFGGTYDEIEGTFNYIMASEWIIGQKGLTKNTVSTERLEALKLAKDKPKPSVPPIRNVKSRLPYKDDEDQPQWEDINDMPNPIPNPETELGAPTATDWEEYMNSLSEFDKRNEE